MTTVKHRISEGSIPSITNGDSPSVRRQNEIISIAKSAFTENQSIAYKDLVREFTDVLPVQERTARKYIKTLRDAKIISTSSGETGIYRLVEA